MSIFSKLTISTISLALAATSAHAAGGQCPKTINASKTWTYDSPTIGSGNRQFSIGVGAGVAATGDCNALSADASVAIRARALSLGGNALEAHLTATTNKDHHHTLAMGIYAFGFQLTAPITLLESDAPLSNNWYDGWTLPVSTFTGNWAGQVAVPLTSRTVNYAVNYNLVADLLAIANYDIKPTALSVGFWGQANVSANARVTGSFSDSKFKATATGSASFVAFRGMAQAYAKFTEATLIQNAPNNSATAPSAVVEPFANNAWRVRALAEYKIDDAIKGKLQAKVTGTYDSNPGDSVPGISISHNFDVYQIPAVLPTSVFTAKNWKLDRTFYKPFRS